jgi:hypothetical protein
VVVPPTIEEETMKLYPIKLKPLVGRDGKPLVNPAVIEHEHERRLGIENRVADHITAFSGSMRFVYIHVVWFGLWKGWASRATLCVTKTRIRLFSHPSRSQFEFAATW